jgi:cardiolipin synthase
VGTAAYVQALAAAARDGVDVRLMVPGASDIPALTPLSRAGYRPLLQAGVRVFEWNGTMLHAKSAVADGFWTRIGSTNLNIASWMGNYELDVAIEDAGFAGTMAKQFEIDLKRTTEIVLTRRNRVRPVPGEERAPGARRAMSGSAGRAAAGAISVGSALGAALTGRRVLDAAESGLLAKMGGAILALSIIAAIWPHFVAWPAAVLGTWLGVAWLVKAFALRRAAQPSRRPAGDGEGGATRDGDPPD